MMSARHLRVVRRGHVLLDDVSVDMAPGELVVLLGPNGAGKTTLMTVLAGLCRPDLGSVTVSGTPLGDYTAGDRARLIAYLAQKQDFLWDLEVHEVIALGAGSPKDAEQTIAHLQLRELAGRRIKTLSGGERSRVMLARALAANTPLLLADEPAADLDIRQQRSAMRLLRQETRQRRLGVLVVLHDLNLAFAFADRVMLLDRGHLVIDGSAEAIATSPELDRVFGQRFLRTRIDDRTVVLPLEDTPA